MEKSPKLFPLHGKILLAGALVLIALFGAAAEAAPFAVAAARATWADQPAVRVSFDFPADHHLYSSFSVAAPDGAALAPLSVPAPDVDDPNDVEPYYSKSFSAFYAPPAADSVVVTYQGCAGTVCFMPETVVLSLGAAPDSAPAAIPEAAAAAPDATAGFPLAAHGEPRRLVGYADVPAFLAFLDPTAAPAAPASAWKLFLDDPDQFLRRRGVLPAIVLILVGGFLLDLLRRPLAFLRPVGLALARLGGFVLVLPLLPFIFVWSFFAELVRPKASAAPGSTATPMQAATRRTADVIDLAAFRQRNKENIKR